MNTRQHQTTYFAGEGRPFVQDCLDLTFAYCAQHGIKKIVIFTGSGEGPLYAFENLLPKPEYSDLRMVAVTPPHGRPYRSAPDGSIVMAGVGEALRRFLNSSGIPVVSAHLPFKGIQIGEERTSDWGKVGEAFGVLGGGFSLCIQAILLACDAGYVDAGEQVAAATADTSLIAIAARTESFLSPINGLIIEHILSRPRVYTISKPHHLHWYAPPPQGSQPTTANNEKNSESSNLQNEAQSTPTPQALPPKKRRIKKIVSHE